MNQPEFKAFYGIFNADLLPQDVVDVTNVVKEQFRHYDKLIIPAAFHLHFIDHPFDGKRCFLQIQIKERKYNILQDEYQTDIEINLNEKKKHIKLVYYAFINRHSNWQEIISGQLKQLKSYGLFDEVDFYLHITDPSAIFDDVTALVHSICKDVIISFSAENEYEYPGLRLVYDLAVHEPDSIFLYLHTKGISYGIQKRKSKEIALLAGTFQNWRRNLEFFGDKSVNKMGLFIGDASTEKKEELITERGWIWFNFWYAKGSYIIDQCLEPAVNANRYYFEVWLAGPPADESDLKDDCFSIYTGSRTRYFNSFEADYGLRAIAEKMGLLI